jgi:hypothetical protein
MRSKGCARRDDCCGHVRAFDGCVERTPPQPFHRGVSVVLSSTPLFVWYAMSPSVEWSSPDMGVRVRPRPYPCRRRDASSVRQRRRISTSALMVCSAASWRDYAGIKFRSSSEFQGALSSRQNQTTRAGLDGYFEVGGWGSFWEIKVRKEAHFTRWCGTHPSRGACRQTALDHRLDT